MTWFSPPPPPQVTRVLSSATLVASTWSEVSNVVGSLSLDTSSLVTTCSILQSFSDKWPLQVSSSRQSCITSFQFVSGVVELGKRLRSSSLALPNYKLFQK
jgi:hypothetical protein